MGEQSLKNGVELVSVKRLVYSAICSINSCGEQNLKDGGELAIVMQFPPYSAICSINSCGGKSLKDGGKFAIVIQLLYSAIRLSAVVSKMVGNSSALSDLCTLQFAPLTVVGDTVSKDSVQRTNCRENPQTFSYRLASVLTSPEN